MAHRYFCETLTPDARTVMLTGEEAKHLAVVLRAKVGDALTLCDGKGNDYAATVQTVSDGEIFLAINSCAPSVSEPTKRVILYVGYPKLDKLETVIQKATELGAAEIVPFFSRFCVVTPKKEEAKNERYNRIAKEAAKQSGRGVIPHVAMPLTYKQMLTEATKCAVALFCYVAGGDTILSRLSDGTTIAIITGSEGGFSAEEAQLAKAAGCVQIGLGPRILRCETAPLAALTAVMTLTGNLQ